MSNICVYGSSSAAIGQIYLDAAFELGALLAKNGYGLVFGGGDMGVMGAAARGARGENGRIIGVLPEFMRVDGIPYSDCDELIWTKTMRERKRTMEELSCGFVAAPGGIGTLEEFFEILTLKQLHRHKKPVALLDTNHYYAHISHMMELCVCERFAKAQTLELYSVQATPRGVMEYLAHYQYKESGLKWFADGE